MNIEGVPLSKNIRSKISTYVFEPPFSYSLFKVLFFILGFELHFFYKNALYKNTKAQIIEKLRTILEQLPGWMQGPRKTSSVRNRSNQLTLDTQMSNEWTECTSSEETLQ